ncbi:MAG: efflux RND transporter permease subunit [Balneolaceae bacterium]|nr:efflux RND transporter permease subunit [Balneolaceae bacterium]
MKRLITYFIKYPVMVNLVVGMIIILGISALYQTRTMLPKEDINFITVDVVYRGASPQEVEEGITMKIEDNLEGIQGIQRVTSTSSENIARIRIELKEYVDSNVVLQDVKNAVDKITTFPEGIDEPNVVKEDILNATLNFAVTGDLPRQTLKDFAKEIEDDLLRKEGLSQIVIRGYPEEEIEVQLRERLMRSYGLTFSDVTRAIQQANLETSGGEIKTVSQRMLIRADAKEYYARDLRDIVIRATENGEVVTLGDVAAMTDRFADDPQKNYLDGKPAVVFQVFSLNEEDILENAKYIRNYIEEFNSTHEGVEAVLIEDTTINLKKRINTLANSGITGAVLVLLVLALFLNKRLAFWVALKIPVAHLGMMVLSVFYDLTINQVSMFGAIIVLGILVDDGVVIAENIYQHCKEQGKPALKAAVDGTLELMPAVFFSMTTTATAFTLFFFIHGIIGNFFSDIAFVVVATLIVAMIESFFLLPAHIGYSRALTTDEKQSKLEKQFNQSLVWFRDNLYTPLVRWTVKRFSWGSLGVGVLAITAVVGTVAFGWLNVTFLPNVEQDVIEADLELTPGVRENRTEEILMDIEEAVYRVNQQISSQRDDGRAYVQKVERIIGPKSHEGKIRATLLPGEEREVLSFKAANIWRQEVGEIPEAVNISYGNPGFMFGAPVSIALKGDDLENLRAAKNELKQAMQQRPDLKDVVDNDKQGITEINLELKPKARLLGLNLGFVMKQVRAGFFGMEAQSLQRGDEEVKIWVRYAEQDRNSIHQIEDMRIRTPGGREFPLGEIANISLNSGVLAINHQEGEREIKVEADITDLSVPVLAVIADIEENTLPGILQKYPGIDYSLEGQMRESAKAQSSILAVLSIFMIAMFSLIVMNFKSFNQAVLVVLVLPFALIGVVNGHLIHGLPLSMFSGIGMIALLGVLINNSLVFVDTFNQRIREGLSFYDSVIETARMRFRPILLTTITTVAGLAPL